MRNFELLANVKAMSCQVCGKRPVDPCHIKSFGSGGPDSPENIIPLCRKHHTEQHSKGWVTFVRRNQAIAWHLEQKGWKVVNEFDGRQKLSHPEMGNA